jgi:protein SCO1/2
MKTRIYTTLALVGAIAAAHGQDGDRPGGIAWKQMDLQQRLGNQVPLDARFKDESGKDIQFGDLVGERPLIVLPMFFTCGGVCRIEMESLFKVINKDKKFTVGEDFDVVFFGIHPKETYELAREKEKVVVDAYKRPSGEQGFHALTGDMASIRQVTDAIGFKFTYDEKTGQINHPAGITFLNKKGEVSGYIFGKDYATSVVRKNVEAAEAGEYGVEPEVVFLGCIMIDPVTGQKSLVIKNLMKVLGISTVLMMGCWIAFMSKKYRVAHVSDASRGGDSLP